MNSEDTRVTTFASIIGNDFSMEAEDAKNVNKIKKIIGKL